MFVIVNANTVIWGPKRWSKVGFERVLQDDLEITFSLPVNNDNFTPITVDANTKILRVIELDVPALQDRIERLDGPYWNFFEDRAEIYYVAGPLPLEFVKAKIKERIAEIRFNKETRGFQANVQNTMVTIETSREARAVMLETASDMQAGDTVEWKFKEGWFTITRAQMIAMRTASKNFVQSTFTWEKNKSAAIDAAVTLQELRDLIVEDIDA
jgi:hypothetical protein